jgi:hypothetical protein
MRAWWLVAGFQLGCLASSQALVISLNADAGMDSQAIAGFQRAANYWQSVLADAVTVNINIGFKDLGKNASGYDLLGGANATTEVFSAAAVLGALGGDASSSNDALAVSHLPSLSAQGGLSFYTQKNTEGGSRTISLDSDYSGTNSNNNRYLELSTANAKALGWTAPSVDFVDASIDFSSVFSWDFDPSDGVGSSRYDFVGVAIHEIGHALGFTSGVDAVDYYITNSIDLDPYAAFTTLDLFRYSANGALNLGVGAAAYFSIDGGVTNLGAFSTGSSANGGDGQQASHWKDNLGLGIMDPSVDYGLIDSPSALDIVAFDVIGWNLVPEPSAMLLGALGLVCAVGRRRR